MLGGNLLGQARVWIRVAVDTADGYMVRGTVAREPCVSVPGHSVGGRRFALFFCASDFTGETVASVAVHRESGSGFWK